MKLGTKLSELTPPGLSGGETINATSSTIFRQTKPFGQDLLRDLQGSEMGELLRKDLENEIRESSKERGETELDLESEMENLRIGLIKGLEEDLGDANFKGRSLALGGRMIKEG